jgi:fucose permease
MSLLLPAACYVYIAAFGLWAVSVRRRLVPA